MALSALDVELLDQWALADAPFEVVARGLRKAAEAHAFDAAQGKAGLRSLSACKKQVAAELKKYFKLTAGAGTQVPATGEDELLKKRFSKLKGALRKAGEVNPSLSPRLALWAQALPAPADFSQAMRQDELALALVARALPHSERQGLLREARQLVQKVKPLSAEGRKEALRLHRAALLRRDLDLPAFW